MIATPRSETFRMLAQLSVYRAPGSSPERHDLLDLKIVRVDSANSPESPLKSLWDHSRSASRPSAARYAIEHYGRRHGQKKR
jgi:hypothetical protein